ncbi:MAG: hypothetical protein U1E27_06915 [Kiritimatiellia bacterium]|nr:hypothetical protein [Kiritimatiellia bacterium]
MTLSLSMITFLVSGLFGAPGAFALLAPESARRAAAAFPRHRGAGWILSAVALTIVTAVVLGASLGRFDVVKPYLYVAAPVALVLICWLLGELLAARALGGLLLLAGNPMLVAARWEETPWRLAVVVAAYAAVLAGMVLVVGPHWFRRTVRPALETPIRARMTGALLLGIGLGFLALALGPYRTGP